MVIESKFSGNIFTIAISSGGKKPGTVTADFDPDKVARFVEGHCDGSSFRRNFVKFYNNLSYKLAHL